MNTPPANNVVVKLINLKTVCAICYTYSTSYINIVLIFQKRRNIKTKKNNTQKGISLSCSPETDSKVEVQTSMSLNDINKAHLTPFAQSASFAEYGKSSHQHKRHEKDSSSSSASSSDNSTSQSSCSSSSNISTPQRIDSDTSSLDRFEMLTKICQNRRHKRLVLSSDWGKLFIFNKHINHNTNFA